MKHKLRIRSVRWEWDHRRPQEPRILWYVYCNGCKWEVPLFTWPDGATRFGRPTLADAVAIGALHQLRHLPTDGKEFTRVGSCPPCDDYDELNGLNG